MQSRQDRTFPDENTRPSADVEDCSARRAKTGLGSKGAERRRYGVYRVILTGVAVRRGVLRILSHPERSPSFFASSPVILCGIRRSS